RRINAAGALASLWVGFAFGIARLGLEYAVTEGIVTFAAGSIGDRFVSLNFLHFALVLFVICGAILAVASRLAPAPSDAKLEGVAFDRNTRLGGTNGERMLTIALVALVIVVWFVFSPFGIAR
ncbi:MAG: sodium transporter, partial [Gemmatimonadetes bacterium]|nr:sodium transporter [Gemmatimonadota bacterium]